MRLMMAAGKWGGILVLIALMITLIKQLIAFIGFVTGAIKLLIVVVFIALIIGVGYLAFKAFLNKRKSQD